jgi:hypothetical protein
MHVLRAAGVLMFVLGLTCYKGVIVAGVAQFLLLGSWATLLQVFTLVFGFVFGLGLALSYPSIHNPKHFQNSLEFRFLNPKRHYLTNFKWDMEFNNDSSLLISVTGTAKQP